MRGNDNGRFFRSVLGDGLAELGLGGNVQAVGRLVHIIIKGIAGQGEGNPGLLELAGTHGVHFLRRIHLENLKDFLELGMVEFGPECAVLAGESPGPGMYGNHFIGEIELLRQKRGLTVDRISAIHLDGPLLGLLEAAQKRKKGGLPYAILSQKAVDASTLHVHRDIFEYLFGTVTEG